MPAGDRRAPARSPGLLIACSLFDGNPQVSPDGTRVAFCSVQSGEAGEIWTVAADGTDPRQLTRGPGRWQCGPTWSPDGRRIAFDASTVDGNWHIWVIDATGGVPHQLTELPGEQNMPTWSHDGQWLYFSWQADGARDIWRVHLTSGVRERVTRGGGGLVGRESADGSAVY